MSNLRIIRKELVEMWNLVLIQLEKSYIALEQNEKDLAREIILIEDRVNSSEFLIEMECRKYIANKSQQPINVSFAMAALKINMHLERVGDTTENNAYYVLNAKLPFTKEIFEHTGILLFFKETIQLLQCTLDSYQREDIELCKKMMNKSAEIAKKQDVNKLIISYLEKFPAHIDQSLHVLTIFRNLERINEQIRSIALEVITVLENRLHSLSIA